MEMASLKYSQSLTNIDVWYNYYDPFKSNINFVVPSLDKLNPNDNSVENIFPGIFCDLLDKIKNTGSKFKNYIFEFDGKN